MLNLHLIVPHENMFKIPYMPQRIYPTTKDAEYSRTMLNILYIIFFL